VKKILVRRAASIDSKILLLRGQRVMLDADIAGLFGVTTSRLNEQVRRNCERFPPDFMFRLTSDERDEVIAKCDHLQRLKFSPVLPVAFTDHDVIGRSADGVPVEGVSYTSGNSPLEELP